MQDEIVVVVVDVTWPVTTLDMSATPRATFTAALNSMLISVSDRLEGDNLDRRQGKRTGK